MSTPSEYGPPVTVPADRPISAGRYIVFEAFASGGMGTVHFGHLADGTGGVVAVKRLHPHLRKDASFTDSILDEARLAMSVRHPNVVSVIDVVATASELLLVMEYVPGLSLHELARAATETPVPFEIAVTVVVDVLHGLSAAHEAVGPEGKPLGLVHRDISPQNLLVGTDGRTKLTDFGVAKAAGRLRSTRDGSLKGKIAYMSPEQLAGSALDGRSDVYSTAVVLWEMLAGRPMFDAESDVALIGKAMRGPVVRVADIVPDVPRALDVAIWRALSRDPGRRFQTAQAFADALVAAVGPGDSGVVSRWAIARGRVVLEARERTVSQVGRQVAHGLRAIDIDQGTPAAMMLAPRAGVSRTSALVLAATLVLGGIGATALYASLSRTQDDPVAPVTIGPASTGEAKTETPPTAPAVAPAAPAVAPSAPAVAPATTAAPATRAPTEAPRSRPQPPSSRQAKDPAPRRAEPKRVCDPPYSIDANGDKHFKAECLR